jgi:cell division protein FtsZ
MREVKDVMSTIKAYTHEEATVIFGTVFDDGMEDQLRVTVVATGLGGKIAAKPKLERVEGYGLRTGTDDRIYGEPVAAQSGYDSGVALPDVFSSSRTRNAAVKAMVDSGMDRYDIPAFLIKQAD